MENKKEHLGTCPVCGKGYIIEKDKTFICNNKRCGFFIHKEIKGTPISSDVVQTIISKGKSDIMRFSNSDGNVFTARIVINGKTAAIQFDNEYLKGKCPLCGGRVQVTMLGYNCENRLKRDENNERKCSFHVNKSLCNREITKEDVERFLEGEIDIFDGFISSNGNEYSAFLKISEEGYVRTCSKVSTCPKCGGTILVGTKAFNCSNFKHKKCRMKIPRKIGGHQLTYNDVKQLCERDDHTTDPVTITQANGTTCLKRLTLDKDYETITI